MILNYTPHPVTILVAGQPDLVLAPAPEGPARVDQLPAALVRGYWTSHLTGPVDGPPAHLPPVYESGGWGEIGGLPASVEPGTAILVSLFTAQAAAQERRALEAALDLGRYADGSPCDDGDGEATRCRQRVAVLRALVVPGTGPADHPVRNEKGHVVAVTRLVRVT